MIRVYTLTIVGSILAISGCASRSSDPGQPLPTPGLYAPAERIKPQEHTAAPLLPQDASGITSLPLETLFAYADHHAPAVLVAHARATLTQADTVEAAFTFPANPTFGAAAGARISQGTSGFDYELSLAQAFEVAGEQKSRRSAADAATNAAHARVDEVRWLTHVEVHRLAWLWMLIQEQRVQTQLAIEFSASLTRITQSQVAAGEVPPLNLLIVQTDLARSKTQLIDITQQALVIQTRLSAISGWPHPTLPPLVGTLPTPHEPLPPGKLLEQLISHHPSLRQRELAVLAQRAQAELARRDAAPEPVLGLHYSRESSPGASAGAPAHIGMLTLSLPLTVWRRNQAGQARAQANLLVADRERAQTMRQLQSDLHVASAALTAALATLDLYESDIIPQLQTHFALLQRAYELGEVGIEQVSQTRERLLDAMTQHMQARVTYFDRAATLEGLVGTENWGTPHLTPPHQTTP